MSTSMQYKYLRRILKYRHMDFEFALWQMLYLCISPRKVYVYLILFSRVVTIGAESSCSLGWLTFLSRDFGTYMCNFGVIFSVSTYEILDDQNEKAFCLGSVNLNLLWYVLSFLFLLTSRRIKQNFASFLVFLIICTILTGFVKAMKTLSVSFGFHDDFKWNEANLGTIFPHVVLWPVFMLMNNAIVFQNCLYIFFCNVIILFIIVLFHMANISCILFHQIPQFPLPQT